jgi:hypothetical protein
VDDVSGAAAENVGVEKQLVDLAGADGVEVDQHNGRMAQCFSEL